MAICSMRNLISLMDYTGDEIRAILDLGILLKKQLKDGVRTPFFAGKVLGLLFQKPSLRTRVSFESLISQHGGSSLYLGSDVGWPDREPARDFFPILTSYLDVLVIRANDHAQVEEAARYCRCPVINGLTNVSHPCQALADVMTMQESAGGLDHVRLAYVGDANNVTWSLAVICSKLGIPLSIGAPANYQFPKDFINGLNANSGSGLIRQFDDPVSAVDGATFVYTDVWTSMGQEAEREQRLKELSSFQVSAELMKHAATDAKFLHCLPARRGEEVAESVIDGPHSLVIPQAENRLHAQKGLVSWLLDT